MGLSEPYLEAVNLSFIFTLDNGEIEDRVKVFTSPLFEGLLINNTKLRDILTRDKMHGNKMTNLQAKRHVRHGIIKRLSLFVKVKFKITPIERQSL